MRQELETADLVVSGDWTPTGFSFVGQPSGAAPAVLEFTGEFIAFEIAIRMFAWSAAVEVLFDGEVVERRELYSEQPQSCLIQLPNTSAARNVVVRGTAPRPESLGQQLLVDRVAIYCPPQRIREPRFTAIRRGNPHPSRFLELLRDAAPDAFVLDCGGGERRIGDARVFNLEYGRAEAVDLVADCERIPLADGTVDLLLSQAVLEHVQRPASAAAEIMRVLNPGGVAYVEAAFMQPYHPVPDHYFNHTSSALRLLFEEATVLAEGTFGGLAESMEWLLRIARDQGAPVADCEELVREAARAFDAAAGEVVLRHFASAVWIEISKPG